MFKLQFSVHSKVDVKLQKRFKKGPTLNQLNEENSFVCGSDWNWSDYKLLMVSWKSYLTTIVTFRKRHSLDIQLIVVYCVPLQKEAHTGLKWHEGE